MTDKCLTPTLTVDQRVDLTLAVKNYLEASEKFEEASKFFNEACQGVRSIMPEKGTFLIKHFYEYYLVNVDQHSGDFDVKKIELF